MNTMFLYGRNSIFERLKADPKSIRKIFLEDSFNLPYIEELIKKNKIPLERLSPKALAKIKSADNLQGIIAKVDNFRYASFDDFLEPSRGRPLTLIFLDRIYDPQNLGSIIRTVACFGGFAVIIPKYKACEVNETVLHVAQGGENYIPVSMVSNLSNSIIAAKKSGYWIVGAVVSDNAQDVDKISLPFPLGLVLGSEGEGIRYGVDKHLDIKAHIPMRGASISFNVTVACALLCYEIVKQKVS
jgi:23S rRNA (guanosine2251-2'-O)-methyltransferase